jgi:hypothetical protein
LIIPEVIERASQQAADCLRLRRFRIRLRGNPPLKLGIEVRVQAQADVRADARGWPSSTSLFFGTGY